MCVCDTVFYHQAGDDDDEDGEEEDDGVKTFSAPHVIPLPALQDVFLQVSERMRREIIWVKALQDLYS